MSEQEIQCFELYAHGISPDVIADQLNLADDFVWQAIQKMLESYRQSAFSG